MNKKIIIIHGYESSPEHHKYQLIARELKKLGVEFVIPQFPGGKHPKSPEWLKIIDQEVKAANKPVVLVGHSLGTKAILLYLDQFEQKIDSVILIATFNNEVENNKKIADGNLESFFEYPLDVKKIRGLVNKFVVVHSKDDQLIPYQQAFNISQDLKAELITYDNKGHFGSNQDPVDSAKIFVEVIKSVW